MPTTEEITVQARVLEARVNDLGEEVGVVLQFAATASTKTFHQFEGFLDDISAASIELNKIKGDMRQFNAIVPEENKINSKKDLAKIAENLVSIKAKYFLLKAERQKEEAKKANEATTSSSAENNSVFQVAPIKVPTFDGNFDEFQDFYSLFKSVVDANKAFQPRQKLAYLKSFISGEPLKLISEFRLEDQNYPLALKALEERYLDPRLSADFYLSQLLNYNKRQETVSSYAATHKTVIQAIKQVQVNDLSDYLLFTMSFNNLSATLQADFNKEHKSGIPTTDELLKFVGGLAKGADLAKFQQRHNQESCRNANMNNDSTQAIDLCFYCKCLEHKIFKCKKFKQLSIEERFKFVKDTNLCVNCSAAGHTPSTCSFKKCTNCGKKHNVLLCRASQLQSDQNKKLASTGENSNQEHWQTKINKEGKIKTTQSSAGKIFTGHVFQSRCIILGTCYVRIRNSKGDWVPARGFIDPGSTSTLIIYSECEQLKLPIEYTAGQIEGVNNQISEYTGQVELSFTSRFQGGKMFTTKAVVVDSISERIPDQPIPCEILKRFMHLPLADAHFGEALPVSILFGVEIFAQILSNEQRSYFDDNPVMLYTHLGYVVMGSADQTQTFEKHQCFFLSKKIEMFWNTEQVPQRLHVSQKHKDLEKFFKNTTTRSDSGRYIVRIPFKEQPSELGKNVGAATRNFINLERRFKRDSKLKEQYFEILRGYQRSGHCKVSEEMPRYVIPQQLVLKPEKTSTPLRVTLNCSAKAHNGKSLNDIVHVGPKIQNDLTVILISFRLFKITLCADITKMYRQILIHEDETKYFSYFFREDPSLPMTLYNMTVLPFGLNVAPWLALRVLKQLVVDHGDELPLAKPAFESYNYMDDIPYGANNVEEALETMQQIITLGKKGGFELKKWCSNSEQVMNTIPENLREPLVAFEESDETGVKVLGLCYDPRADCFKFRIKVFSGPITKRNILSFIASAFDPMGLVAVLTFTMKYFMQQLWVEGIGWDDNPSDEFQMNWNAFVKSFASIPNLSVPRLVINDNCILRLVGFCDASEKGFAALAYIQSELKGQFFSSLIYSKTRVAPLKTISLPRLELEGMVLLTNVILYLQDTPVFQKISETHLFSDSTIALNWIRSPSYRFDTFVANRVALIQEATKNCVWRHVKSEENPADLASRPQLPHTLINNKFWFNGPNFLLTSPELWNSKIDTIKLSELPEVKTKTTKVFAQKVAKKESFYNNFRNENKYSRLIRGYAYVFRIRDRIKRSKVYESLSLASEEITRAENFVLQKAQQEFFMTDITLIKKGQPPSKQILKYAPWIDEQGFLRVKGRLGNSSLPSEQKYPIVLHKKCHVAQLIVEWYHQRYLHIGIKQVLAMVSTKFLILSAMVLIRRCIYKCVVCTRIRGESRQPEMANLPKERFREGRSFLNVSSDFAGPFNVTDTSLRKARVMKGYLCIFICMSSKAVHMEFTAELSTPSFMAAFDRFTARRGLPGYVYSDNGSNYEGASNAIEEVSQFLNEHREEIFSSMATRGIRWEFSPPAGPNFNGLAEAAVKAAKNLLYKQMGKEKMSFEQYVTLFTKIEMILNSRPLVSYGTTGEDFFYLAPSHLLIGDYLFALPEKDMSDSLNLREQYHRVTVLQQNFWKRWSREYLNTLIQRTKWHKSCKNIEVGDIVYLKCENTHPLSWPLGKIVRVMPGKDSVVRVAEVKTVDGTYVRPVTKLVPLEINDED